MNFMDLAKEIGAEGWEKMPEEMLSYYPIPEERRSELCSLQMIDELQARFNVFKEYYPIVKEYRIALEQDPLRKAYVDAASLFMRDGTFAQCTAIPIPAPDGTPAGDLLQLFIHIPSIEDSYENYRNRGFSHEETLNFLNCYYESVRDTHKKIVGRPALVTGYFRWLCQYTKARIFSCHGLKFALRLNKQIYGLKSKKNGELRILTPSQRLHQSGFVLGSAGYEDTAFAVDATFEETEDAYLGYAVKNHRFSIQKELFPKEEWELVLDMRDDCVGIHIPAGTDLSPEKVTLALKEAKEIVAKHFPERKVRFFTCTSWIISPHLEKVLKPDSRILSFGGRFCRYPVLCNGKSLFSYVFPNSYSKDHDELAENTSLQRAVKKLYGEGGSILNYGGIIEF
ncbi:MAG: hypothetical protein IKD18_04120 [Clostridia bacterium]|nr:hypothetical protein [Clostridia bacterium]